MNKLLASLLAASFTLIVGAANADEAKPGATPATPPAQAEKGQEQKAANQAKKETKKKKVAKKETKKPEPPKEGETKAN
jgi:ribosomal protein L12E/L44/L45/RPP1/RPP2